MPYMIAKREGKYCLYKKDDDGEPTGDSLGCHKTEEEAMAQMRAIHANEEKSMGMALEMVREYTIGEFRGDYPDVPIAESVNMEEIRRTDPDPLFVTLPIVPKVGMVSENNTLYDEALVNSIATQILSKRPGGRLGHLKEDERSTAFPLPAGLWVGAQRVGETLWGKAYIRQGAAKDYMSDLKKVGGEIATSIYGRGKYEKLADGTRRLTNFRLESLDFADPARAALGYGAIPHLTSEMTNQESDNMAVDKQQIISELTIGDIPAAIRDAIVAEASKQDETAQTIAELTATKTAQEALIAELNTQVDGFRLERLNSVIDAKVAELTDWQVVDDEGKDKLKRLRELLRSQIVTRLGDKQTVERVTEITAAAWEDIKPIAEMVRDVLAGPAAVVGGRKPHATGGAPTLEDTPENRASELSRSGIVV